MMKYKKQFAEDSEDCIREFRVYDRFTFDRLFRNLLRDGYDHEEVKEMILHNCALSTLVMQERIYNRYYLKIFVDGRISDDLLELMNEIFNKHFNRKIPNAEIISEIEDGIKRLQTDAG